MGVRFSLRQLLKSPGFTAIAVVTLALGIGSNAAIFSFINSWILRPSAFPDLDRLVVMFESDKTTGLQYGTSPADWKDWREKSGIFEELAAANIDSFNLTGADDPLRITGYRVSTNFLRTLGVKPALGREFLESEEIPGQDHVVILTHALWRDRFSSDPNVLGRKITLDGTPHTVVGVLPENFQYIPMGLTQLITPLALTPERLASRDARFLNIVGRLKPGVGKARAIAAMTALQSSLEQTYSKTNANRGVLLRTLQEEIDQQSGNGAVKVIFAIVSFVLLMACANVANLMMSRATGRRKEMAVRLAIGAGRWKLVRQMLSETLLVFFTGAALGVFVARWTVAYLLHSIPARSQAYLPNFGHVDLDWQVMAFMAIVALGCGIAFGLAPALEATRFDINRILKDSGGRGAGGASGGRFRKILVAGEMALAVMVVVCGALLANSFVRLMRVDPGFDGERVLVAEILLPPKYQTPASIRQFYDSVVERLASTPGVERAAAGRFTPFSNGGSIAPLFIEGRPQPPDGQVPNTRRNAITAGYIEAMSIPLLAGRSISRQDSTDATPAVLVNDTIVKRYFPNENPLGKRIRLSRTDTTSYTIVGVVKEVKYYYPAAPPENQVYLAFEQSPTSGMCVLARAHGEPGPLAQSIRAVVRETDPNQPVSEIKTIAAQIADRVSGDRILTQVAGAFGVLALFLAAIGIYGVMSYSVSQRTQEIGVRMALGARARDVVAMVVRQGMGVVMGGMLAGIAGAIVMARLLATFLYGVKANDVVTFSVSFLILAAVALAACAIPAHRASRVDPLVALRYE
jgi:putative ABC transport system permease protein